MKKLFVIFTVFVVAITAKVSAQALVARLTTRGGFSYTVPGAMILEGQNTIVIPDKGTIKFVKTGNSFSNVVFLDSIGTTLSMNPTKGGTNGAPTQECKSKLPDACFSTANKNVGMCICMPKDLTNGTPTGGTNGAGGGGGIATAAKIAIIAGAH